MTKIFGFFVLIILVIMPVLFTLWMNLTPGYFQFKCCGVGYLRDKDKRGFACIQMCPPKSILNQNKDRLMLLLSKLDFNR